MEIPLNIWPVTLCPTHTPLQLVLNSQMTSLENTSMHSWINCSILPPNMQPQYLLVGSLIARRGWETLVASFYCELLAWNAGNISWKNPPSSRRHTFVYSTPWLESLMQWEGDWHLCTVSMPVFWLLQYLLTRFSLHFSLLYLYSSHPKIYWILGPLYQLLHFSPNWLSPASGRGKPKIPETSSATSITLFWAGHH